MCGVLTRDTFKETKLHFLQVVDLDVSESSNSGGHAAVQHVSIVLGLDLLFFLQVALLNNVQQLVEARNDQRVDHRQHVDRVALAIEHRRFNSKGIQTRD